MIKKILNGALSTLIVYSIFAFGNWNINPGFWSPVSRNVCALLFTVCLVIIVLVDFMVKQNKEQ